MIIVRYVACSELDRKPVTRGVCDHREDCERLLAKARESDGDAAARTRYWVAEVGAECESWRWLGREKGGQTA